MGDNVISYIEMCRREGTSLQQGMNYALGNNHSVILMSLRRNAPYRDRIEEDGTELLYEGHDRPKASDYSNPKQLDQPERFPSGSLTQNGKFFKAAHDFKKGDRPPEASVCTRRFRPEYGPTTGSSIWSIHGRSLTGFDLFSDFD
jgi:hypothetical protein